MLTYNQIRILLPQHTVEAFNVPKSRSLRTCLFGRPDPQETRRLGEEQFAVDRQYMRMKYNYDIVTCRFVTNNCSHENGEALSASEDNFLVPESTNEEPEERRCSPESEVRHRAGRYTPYNRQTRITGKQ
jgi:hypothetical protein